jgi:hypothetical protein
MPQSFSVTGAGSQSASSGPQAVPSTGTATQIASITTQGTGKFSLNGFLTSGALTDFIIAIATAYPSSPGANGGSVTRLTASAGDFGVISDMVNNATASPQNTAAGSSFYVDMDLQGRAARVDIYAKSTTANTSLTIDATGVGR